MQTKATILAVLLALGSVAASGAGLSHAEDAGQVVAPGDTIDPASEPAPEPQALAVPECASDPKRLGLERIVEIDTTGGPIFGGGHATHSFLKDHEVVLTFDDGPLRPYTRPVLKALADHCTRATFFMVGRMAAADPGMVKEVLAGGHTIGSHTYSHQNLRPLSYFKSRQDFELGLSAVSKASNGAVSPFFRFPYLSENRSVLTHIKKRDTATFFIDIDSKDFQTRDSEVVFKRTMAQVMSLRKGIILMHDIQPSTVGMIRRLLDTLHDKGFKVVHLVAKSKAATLAEFDIPAARALAQKEQAAKDKPLADRSVVWTMAKPGEPGQPAAKAAAAKGNETVKTGSLPAGAASADERGEMLPWSKPAAPESAAPAPAKTAAPAAPPAKKQTRRQSEELPWQARVFSN